MSLHQLSGQIDREPHNNAAKAPASGKAAQQLASPAPKAARAVSLFRRGQISAQPRDVTLTLDQRSGKELIAERLAFPELSPLKVWESLRQIAPSPQDLARNNLFLSAQQSPAARGFDILRTRVLQAMAQNGWTRLAVTSPTHGGGKSFVAVNLALALARLASCRTVLMDLELRQPHLADLFGQAGVGPLVDFITGHDPLEAHFLRMGQNLALALNGVPLDLAAETLLDPQLIRAIDGVHAMLQPDLMIMDMPPALGSDDVIAASGIIDAVLLVTDGTRNSAAEIAACERQFEGRIPLLGVVLNRAQDRDAGRYFYGKR